jgi:hypothetical protein
MKRLCSMVVLLSTFLTGCGEPPSTSVVACADPVLGCRLALNESTVAIRFSEPPQPMRPFVLEVDAPGVSTVTVDFSMRAMDMVPNRYHLIRGTDGRWRAQVVLPVCISGRHDWVLKLEVGNGRVSIPFSTAT